MLAESRNGHIFVESATDGINQSCLVDGRLWHRFRPRTIFALFPEGALT